MDGDSWLLSGFLLALILGGSYFAAAETAFASSNNIRIKNRAESGDRRARAALYVLDHFDKALSTLLIGNNIMHIGSASLATLLITRLWGAGFVAYSTIATTIVVFLVSEMIPKSFANNRPEPVALALAGSLRFLMKLLTPLSAFFTGIGNMAAKRIKTHDIPSVTEDELYDIIDDIVEEGALEQGRSKLLYSALEFDEITVQEVLTARVNVVAVGDDMTYEEILAVIRANKFSRLPVYHDTIDDIVGILNIRRFMKSYLLHGDTVPLSSLMDPPLHVPKKRRIDELLNEMSGRRIHMAVVTDDYGGTLGIVTVEDILEELVGEIWDEDDVVREEFKAIGGGRFEVSADFDIVEALELMLYPHLERGEEEHRPVSAWAQEHFNIIPREGSTFSLPGLEAKVLSIGKHGRIGKMLLTLVEENDEPPAIDS